MNEILKKVIRYTLGGCAVFVVVLLIFSPDFRTETRIMFQVVTGQTVAALETQLDQGSLALKKFDEAYAKAKQRLVTLKHLQLDAQLCCRRAQERATDYRRRGKEELAVRNDEQVAFYEKQQAGYAKSIANRTQKLDELRNMRERAREDVRLARERIAMLKATRDALDDSGQEEMLERANENIEALQSKCNKLSAEIEVLNMEE